MPKIIVSVDDVTIESQIISSILMYIKSYLYSDIVDGNGILQNI